jgi:hypothetical protein
MEDGARLDDIGQVRCVFRTEVRFAGRRVELRFAELDGRPVCVGLEVGPPVHKEAGGVDVFAIPFVRDVDRKPRLNPSERDLERLTSEEIRFPLQALIDAALLAAVDRLELYEGLAIQPGVEPREREAIEIRARDLSAARTPERKKPGRPPKYGREHFEQVAGIYNETVRAGRRDPTSTVGQRFSVSKGAAAKWVARARAMNGIEVLPPP